MKSRSGQQPRTRFPSECYLVRNTMRYHMRQPIRTLSEDDAPLDSFHDCHFHGLGWQRDRFSFSLDLQYILQWIPPASATAGYSFLVAEAQLSFQSSAEVNVAIDW